MQCLPVSQYRQAFVVLDRCEAEAAGGAVGLGDEQIRFGDPARVCREELRDDGIGRERAGQFACPDGEVESAGGTGKNDLHAHPRWRVEAEQVCAYGLTTMETALFVSRQGLLQKRVYAVEQVALQVFKRRAKRASPCEQWLRRQRNKTKDILRARE